MRKVSDAGYFSDSFTSKERSKEYKDSKPKFTFGDGSDENQAGLNGEGWTMSEEVVNGTKERYEEVVSLLIGSSN